MEGQGARAGSVYIALSLGVAGAMTYFFLGVTARFLGRDEYGMLANLWSATLLFGPLMWAGTNQTLGRYIAEREARGEDWRPVVEGTRRSVSVLLAVFLGGTLLLGRQITDLFFGGEYLFTAAFAGAVVCYSLGFFRRGLLSGHRQFSRVGASYVSESVSRVGLSVVLLVAGLGALGPALGIVLAPLLGVLFVRVGPTAAPQRVGAPFRARGAFGFGMPILVSMACAQALANGGGLLVSGLGGPGAYAQAGLFVAAITLVRAPQSVLGPAISNLLPHLSRLATLGDHRRMRLFVWETVGGVGLVGVLLVGGTWLFGEFAMRLVYGSRFVVDRDLLTVLAALAATLLLCELLNQVLFAKGLAWFAAASWVLGLVAGTGAAFALQAEILARVSYALALGALVTAAVQTVFLATLKRRPPVKPGEGQAP